MSRTADVSTPTCRAGSEPAATARRRRREILGMTLASLAVAAALLAWSVGTPPTIGDEARHWRRATNYFEADQRIPYDPLYPPGKMGYFPYWDSALWHLGLAKLWKLAGHTVLVRPDAFGARMGGPCSERYSLLQGGPGPSGASP